MIDVNYSIATHKLGRTYDLPHFFILNKGLNSGRPMREPCPNCFVVTIQTVEQRETLYYLCFSLQIGSYFSYYLVGSVILFIRIDDSRKVLDMALRNYKQEQWAMRVEKLKKITVYEENLKKQLKTIGQLKLAFLRA
ncbi:hypothetical protein QWY81_14985 [Polaribacter undariae]|uniref:Uncharacterized protein n=1 Tax=Polaribacter sejongensis TaxID=985043 RepID=A0AAJ1QYQ2_9FLAO|nr:hypothetical protein [Polaribacter undariae]MDN3620768.1 hypothetical protein [Polaribacter undariae]UWD31367.1 hypothetical protein NQP51_14660 [Polaribacter undariae]